MSSNPSAPRSTWIIRAFLIGMPAGLIVIGVGALTWTTLIRPKPANPVQPEFAARGGGSASISPATLRSYVSTLTERIGPRHAGALDSLNAARFYIASTLGINNIGYQAEEQTYQVDDQEFANVEVELTGTRWPEQLLVVGAHYDSVATTPGADDNASGVAALLALADTFAGDPQGRTIRFVAFTNEEPPWFQTDDMGSARYAKRSSEDRENIVAMLSLESLGYFSDEPNSQRYPPEIADRYPKTGNFVAVVGNLESGPLAEFVHASFVHAEAIPAEFGAFPALTPGVGWSDHWSFWRHGYPAVMITDTAPFRNPHYHQPTDTIETLDFNRLAAATVGIEMAIRHLANTPELPWADSKKSAKPVADPAPAE